MCGLLDTYALGKRKMKAGVHGRLGVGEERRACEEQKAHAGETGEESSHFCLQLCSQLSPQETPVTWHCSNLGISVPQSHHSLCQSSLLWFFLDITDHTSPSPGSLPWYLPPPKGLCSPTRILQNNCVLTSPPTNLRAWMVDESWGGRGRALASVLFQLRAFLSWTRIFPRLEEPPTWPRQVMGLIHTVRETFPYPMTV